MKKLTMLLVLGLLGSGAGLPVGAQSAPPTPVPGGRPAPGWTAPVVVSTDQAHRETSLVLSPTDPDLFFICTPSGVPNTAYNQSYFHLSRDRGKTWAPLDIEGPPDDLRNYFFEGGDCDVTFDREGTMYTADTWLGSLSVGHSRDGGKTWTGTPIAGTTPIVDRPWLVGGPGGTVHVSYQDLQCCLPSAIWYTHSTDYGQSFEPAVPVATAGPDGGFTWEGNLVVSPEGENLYLVYTRRQTATGSQGPETVWVAASHDSGASWTSHLVATRDTSASFLYPSMAMDRAGYLHVVFASPTAKDVPIWYSVSKDDAGSWSEPRALSRGAAGYSPWVTARGRGQAAVAWYGSTDPKATTTTDSDWYFYWARITGGHTGSPRIATGRTTQKPIYKGQSLIPEFEMVQLDKRGRMHIGMSARWVNASNRVQWAIYYQTEKP